MISQSKLKEFLHYEKDTGVFTWLVDRATNAKKGSVAGSINKRGYLVLRVDGGLYQHHRVAWLYVYGTLPNGAIDHINHIKDDNRISNLRDATHSENQRNMSLSKRNKSGFTGVCWHKGGSKWRVQIRVKGRPMHIGLFASKDDAIKARKEANIKYGYHNNHGIKQK